MDKMSLHLANPIFQNIIDALPVLLFWTDKNHVILGNNNLHATKSGFSSSHEVIGLSMKKWGKVAGLDDAFLKKLYTEHTQVIDKKEGQTLEYTVGFFDKDRNKKEGIYLSCKYPLFNEKNEVIGLIGISMDITELKNTQKALELSKEKAEAASTAKSEFIANMSHDIRTPITGIIGMVQDLLNTAENTKFNLEKQSPNTSENTLSMALHELAEKVEENSDILLGSADQLLQLCNEILETTRLDSGKPVTNNEAFDLPQLVQQNLDLLEPVARHRQLDLSCKIDPLVPQYIDGLRNYLDRTLLNLISNALKFTNKGSVKVLVSVVNQSQKKYYLGEKITLQISVEDTGIGIPENKFKTIFEHFSRLTASYEGNYKGSGLGLYTVKRYVEGMQGKIDLQSEVGKGSTFTLTLPFEVSDHQHRVSQSIRIPKTIKQKKFAKKTASIATASKDHAHSVLVVEDNPAAALAVQSSLTHFDCAVDVAETGAQALEKASTGCYDLILMDVGLPDFDGIEATKKIRALKDSKKSRVPIVALTGHASNPEMRKEAIDAGMQTVLSKPAQPLSLNSVFENYVFKTEEIEQVTEKENLQESGMSPSLEAIDWKACVRMCNGDSDFAYKMLSMMEKDLHNSEAVLAKAYARSDTIALRAELHRCRGGVCYLKLPELEQTLKKFHEAVKEVPQDPDRLKTTYAELQQAIKHFRAAWETLK